MQLPEQEAVHAALLWFGDIRRRRRRPVIPGRPSPRRGLPRRPAGHPHRAALLRPRLCGGHLVWSGTVCAGPVGESARTSSAVTPAATSTPSTIRRRRAGQVVLASRRVVARWWLTGSSFLAALGGRSSACGRLPGGEEGVDDQRADADAQRTQRRDEHLLLAAGDVVGDLAGHAAGGQDRAPDEEA